ncbi:hypothetical protein THAOC_09646 [Thalassiosira oceanica]|uniref:Uncharacterized protein n=1 Tax=Thalassiosira oceanica TaxID=159749 RepID=K0SUN9_THAOC|nr:hypothetical protein THAOC_09646 [Thalassiosira oceanica]|eukprot:EJK69130.1 hypothetical protein THAOC_09646 [Thalassiosira oceanica]
MASHTTMHSCIVDAVDRPAPKRTAPPSKAERKGIMVHIPSSPHLLSTESIIPLRYGFCLSPRRSFRPLFINVYETATSVLRPRKPTNFLCLGRAGRKRCVYLLVVPT